VRLPLARPKPANGSGRAELAPAAGQGTPAELAAGLLAHLQQAGRADAPACESAQLIVDAAKPWAPGTAHLFPARARQRAVELLLLGAQLAKARPTTDERRAFVDAWSVGVLPLLVQRNFLEPGTVLLLLLLLLLFLYNRYVYLTLECPGVPLLLLLLLLLARVRQGAHGRQGAQWAAGRRAGDDDEE
jgi:hypothetical protein